MDNVQFLVRVAPEVRQRARDMAANMGLSNSMSFEEIIMNTPLKDDGTPIWWEPQQEQLPDTERGRKAG
ncbi:hypothetical protein ACT3UD_16375 [Glutamicibacter sp. 287]|uniref:hypothetical protein n=1 Tax=Glutamicibacter TaxID=1742989 RepID=UPI000BB9A25F|nr:hypothetical protein [Glutamicibacter sp. BW80]PCC28477.1 hypothetical protein CIK76_11415 [Glutamicibacter sp. BW80]